MYEKSGLWEPTSSWRVSLGDWRDHITLTEKVPKRGIEPRSKRWERFVLATILFRTDRRQLWAEKGLTCRAKILGLPRKTSVPAISRARQPFVAQLVEHATVEDKQISQGRSFDSGRKDLFYFASVLNIFHLPASTKRLYTSFNSRSHQEAPRSLEIQLALPPSFRASMSLSFRASEMPRRDSRSVNN